MYIPSIELVILAFGVVIGKEVSWLTKTVFVQEDRSWGSKPVQVTSS